MEILPFVKWANSPEAKKGYIYLTGLVHPLYAEDFVKKLDELNRNDSIERIRIIINITGETETPVDVLISGIDISKKPVDVINMGACYCGGLALYAAATGRRYAFPDTTFTMISRNLEEHKLRMKNILKFKTEKYEGFLTKDSNLPKEWFPLKENLIYFTEKEAVKYNLIDEIITELP